MDTDYHQKEEAGTTRATVAGTAVGSEDPLHITNPEASDDLANLNRDRDNVQERHVVKDKHVRVFLPVPSFVLKGIRNALFADEVNAKQRPMSVDEFDAMIAQGIEEAQVERSDLPEPGHSSDEATVVDGEQHEDSHSEPTPVWGYRLADESGEGNTPSMQVFPIDLVGESGEVFARTRIVVEGSQASTVGEFISEVHENETTRELDIKYRNGEVTVYASIDADAAEQYLWYPGQEELGRSLSAKEWMGVLLSQEVMQSAISGGDSFAGSLFEGANKAAHGLVNGVLQLTVGVSNAAESFLIDPEDFMYKSLEFTGKVIDSTYNSIYKFLTREFYQERFGDGHLPEGLGDFMGGGVFDVGMAAFTVGASRLPLAAGPRVLKSEFVDVGKNLANALPENLEFARVIKPGQVDDLIKGKSVNLSSYPGASEAFITTSEALPRGLSRKELAEMLTIYEKNVGGILRFKLEEGSLRNLATPYNRLEMPGFINGGKTAGGLPEFVVPNHEINLIRYELEILD